MRPARVPAGPVLLPTLAAIAVLASTAACSGADEAPVAPATTVQATDPVPPGDTHAPLTASPGCGVPGARVVLKMGWTTDQRVPACFRLDAFRVRFGNEKAVIEQAGTTMEGYCALDVIVPPNATTGSVRVLTEQDTYETDVPFAIGCP